MSATSDAAAYGLIEVDTSDLNSSSDPRPACRFFLSAGGCRNGWKCVFKHTRPACVFYSSRSGCKYGSSCRFLHDSGSSGDSTSGQTAVGLGSSLQAQQQGLTFDWGVTAPGIYSDTLVPADTSQGLVLLLGEGDFTFTAALLKQRAAAGVAATGDGIVATSYEQQAQLQQIYPGSVLRERLKQLTAAGGEHHTVPVCCIACIRVAMLQ